jgi:hypothetical protein
MDPNNTGLAQRLRGSLVTLVALYVNNVRFAQCATSVDSISTDIGDEERLVDFYLMHFQLGKHARFKYDEGVTRLALAVERYLEQMPLESFPENWSENPWALHPVQLIPMIWAFVLCDVSLAKRRHERGTMLLPGSAGAPQGAAKHSLNALNAARSLKPRRTDWFDAHCDMLLSYFNDASADSMDPRSLHSLRSTGIDPKLLAPPSLQDVAVEGRARSMLTNFFEDVGLAETFPSSAGYTVNLVLANRPDADTDDGFAALCSTLATAGSVETQSPLPENIPGDCVSTGRLPSVWPPLLLPGLWCGVWFWIGVWFWLNSPPRRPAGEGQPKSQKKKKKKTQKRRLQKEREAAAESDGRIRIRGSTSSSEEPEPVPEEAAAPTPQSPAPATLAKEKNRGRKQIKDQGVATVLRRFLFEPASEHSAPATNSAAPQPVPSVPETQHWRWPLSGVFSLLAANHARWQGNTRHGANQPECSICMESYSASGGVVPRLLVTCGHEFCEGCLDKMLRPLQFRNGRKQLECPTCRAVCPISGGRAVVLPTVYALLRDT